MFDIKNTGLPEMKWAFTTRRVDRRSATQLIQSLENARPGDLICAEIVSIGQHSGVQLAAGRRAELYPGDKIAVCVGARYAPDQFECLAKVDGALCHLAAAGGIAGTVTQSHASMKRPTELNVLGLLADNTGKPLNIRDFALNSKSANSKSAVTRHCPVFTVFGSSMNAGKTTTAASLVHGLTKVGFQVGACKATGTGAFGDYFKMKDAGAIEVLDFTDLGYPSTVGASASELLQVVSDLIGHLRDANASAIVVEIADGILQQETSELVNSPEFRDLTDAVFFAGADAMGTISGVQNLLDAGHHVIAASGKISSSPLASREVATKISVPIMSPADLENGETIEKILATNGVGFIRDIAQRSDTPSIAA